MTKWICLLERKRMKLQRHVIGGYMDMFHFTAIVQRTTLTTLLSALTHIPFISDENACNFIMLIIPV